MSEKQKMAQTEIEKKDMEINDLRVDLKNRMKELELLNQRSKEMEQHLTELSGQKLKESMAERDEQIVELQNDLEQSEMESKDLRDQLDVKSKEYNEVLSKWEALSRENEGMVKKN